MKNRVLNIYNIPALYRKRIYQLIDEEFNCLFLFGDEQSSVAKFDISILKKAKFIHSSFFKSLKIQFGLFLYAFGSFDSYIMTSETNNVSQWLLLFFLKFFPKKKSYVWTHGLYGYESRKQLIIRKFYYGLSDGVLVYGNRSKQLIIEKGLCSHKKIFVIHNSLDYDTQLSIRSSLSVSSIYKEYFKNERPTIIFIGRLTAVKKLNLLLEAVSLLCSNGYLFNIVFVGDGDERLALEQLVIKLRLNNSVWFYGGCYNEQETASLLFNADLCVSPGNVGLTAIHSMMYGTPVITHGDFKWQMPEYEVIMPGKTGDFFENNNSESLAKVILRWFNDNALNRDIIRRDCCAVIDAEWNPRFQIRVIKTIICQNYCK